jgi:hypothetical protein
MVHHHLHAQKWLRQQIIWSCHEGSQLLMQGRTYAFQHTISSSTTYPGCMCQVATQLKLCRSADAKCTLASMSTEGGIRTFTQCAAATSVLKRCSRLNRKLLDKQDLGCIRWYDMLYNSMLGLDEHGTQGLQVSKQRLTAE